MNRQVAFAYASAGVAASVAAIAIVGSAFGFGLAPTPVAEATWTDPAAEGATEDYEAQQTAYEESLAEYQQAQAEGAQEQIRADWWTLHNQRTAAQAAAAAEVEAQREAGLQVVEAQLAAQQAAAAAELQAWLDEQRASALDQLETDIDARDEQALDDLAERLAATQGTAPPAGEVVYQNAAPAAQPLAAPVATAVATATAAPAPVEYLTYGVAGIGEVVLAYSNQGSLSLYGVYVGGGWVYKTESNGPRTVKLKFFNTQTGADDEWKATIESGRIKVEG